jgi:hypothetical protein
MIALAIIGVVAGALLGWVTSWAFALFAFGALLAGVAANQMTRASPAEVPLWASSGSGQLALTVVMLLSLLSPLLIGAIWFRWWWGLVGYAAGGLAAATLAPVLGNPGARLALGSLVAVGAAIAL